MKWDDARKQYPEQWVLFEALLAHTDHNHRHVDDMAVIDFFGRSRCDEATARTAQGESGTGVLFFSYFQESA